MPERIHTWLAWSLFALIMLVLAAGLLLWSPKVGFFLVFSVAICVPFAVVGALIASRRPRNAIGWLLLVFAMVAASVASADRYAYYALVEHPGSLPGGAWLAWVATGIWHPAFGFFVFAFLLFPEGRLSSRRWRPVAWIAAANYLMGGVIGVLWGPLFGEFYPYIEPPFRLPYEDAANTAFEIFLFINFGLLALSAISLVLRLRRSVGDERQQLKWFVYAVALFALVFPSSILILGDGSLIVVLLPLVPAAIGVAILRHNLYDVDVVINRTLVYGALTVSLILVYVGSVVALQYVFRTAAGGNSQLAVVASTLLIAALFNPLRRRLQNFIDRLFYRDRYDAKETLEAFSGRLRDEVDVDDLSGDLISVVRDTVRPTHVILWLRDLDETDTQVPGSRGGPEAGR